MYVQCAISSVQFSVCSFQCAVCSIPCAVCSIQCAVYSVQYTECSVQYRPWEPLGAGEESWIICGGINTLLSTHQHSTAMSTKLYFSFVEFSDLHYIALHCTALHCTSLHCIRLHCITVRCISFNFSVLNWTFSPIVYFTEMWDPSLQSHTSGFHPNVLVF